LLLAEQVAQGLLPRAPKPLALNFTG